MDSFDVVDGKDNGWDPNFMSLKVLSGGKLLVGYKEGIR